MSGIKNVSRTVYVTSDPKRIQTQDDQNLHFLFALFKANIARAPVYFVANV